MSARRLYVPVMPKRNGACGPRALQREAARVFNAAKADVFCKAWNGGDK